MNYTEMLNERKRVKDQIFTLERETPESERRQYKGRRLTYKDGQLAMEEYTFMSTPEIQNLRKKDTDLKVAMNAVVGTH